MFVERYIHSLSSSDLREDAFHHATDALAAAALADDTGSGAVLGSLLCRVKYGTGSKACAARAGHLKADIEISTQVGRAAGLTAKQIAERVAGIQKLYSEAELSLDSSLAKLLRIWIAVVTEKGRSRGWVPANTAWDMQAAITLYERVAKASLAHWIDSRCEPCNGAGVMLTRRTCTCCAGSGRAQIEAGRFESDKIRDMVSELEGLYQAHGGRAAAMMRRAA